MNICSACGRFELQRELNPDRSALICPDCGFEDAVVVLPLFVITGAAACGKTTVAQRLTGRLPCLVCEPDYFLRARDTFDTWDDYWSYLLLYCRVLMQNGRPVILPGWVTPSICEASPHSAYFSDVHYLVLSCDEVTHKARLMGRWEKYGQNEPTEASIATALRGAQALRDEADIRENATILDTTDATIAEVVEQVDSWITSRL